MWSNLRHENIQLLLGISTDFNLTVSLIHPWIEKGNAYNYVQNSLVDPRPLLLGIANGLHYLHNHEFGPIVHGGPRGVSLCNAHIVGCTDAFMRQSNVLISDDGQALLIDFSLMSLVNSTFGLPVSVSRMAAINWTAPECLEGPKAAVEQDIWSYGMTALVCFFSIRLMSVLSSNAAHYGGTTRQAKCTVYTFPFNG